MLHYESDEVLERRGGRSRPFAGKEPAGIQAAKGAETEQLLASGRAAAVTGYNNIVLAEGASAE
ncbi:hypothetical protein GCM10011378_17840 [Hymenobacter glacieicola]|uniref:Uncharacterized protein n=1 Tax=Hymenobacter glacieicola TaxID=1562124 RepID=A0ABQ1WSQ5_9BACT|nr:hypothetical protein GCM10011378_17840 [Hymenobacter glacieicola]